MPQFPFFQQQRPQQPGATLGGQFGGQQPPPQYSQAQTARAGGFGSAGGNPAAMMGQGRMAPAGGMNPTASQLTSRMGQAPGGFSNAGRAMGGRMGGGGFQMAQQRPSFASGGAQMAPQRPGGFASGGAQMAPAAQGPRQAPMFQGAGGMSGGMLSDEQSKQKIRELESVRDRYEGLMGAGRDDTGDAFRGVHDYEYEYKDPNAPGAAPGRQRGPMAHELRPLGVTHQGADGYERVDMQRLPLETAGEVGNQRRELDDMRQRMRDLEEQNPNMAAAGSAAGAAFPFARR